MPEMRFRVRWPDGSEELCYSPSLVVKEYFKVGEDYDLEDFLTRSRTALGLASDRVQAKYGFPCHLALAQLDRIEQRVIHYTPLGAAQVRVITFLE
jgi:uncharacterized repeat protein (TIGR04042 family)